MAISTIATIGIGLTATPTANGNNCPTAVPIKINYSPHATLTVELPTQLEACASTRGVLPHPYSSDGGYEHRGALFTCSVVRSTRNAEGRHRD